jgi:hypothetical protein
MGRGILIGVFAGVLAVVLLITGIVVTQSAPPPPKSDCPVPPCGPPPKPTPKGSPIPPLSPALPHFTPFQSPAGYELEFNPNLWSVANQNASDVALELNINGISAVVILRSEPVPSGSTVDEDAVSTEENRLGKDVLGLARDKKPADQVLEPAVGYRSGRGFAFSGVADTPQGPGSPVAVVITAAHDDKLLVTFTLIADEANKKAAFFLTDSLMNTFRFPSEVNE